MKTPSGRQLSTAFHEMQSAQKDRLRARITGDNIEATGVIRSGLVLQAREAVGRGAYEVADIFDASLDMMVDRAFTETEMEDARQMIADAEFERQIGPDFSKCGFWTDFED